MTEPEIQGKDPAPLAWCVCGEKVEIADPQEVTLSKGRPGWQGHCPRCGSPLFTIKRTKPSI